MKKPNKLIIISLDAFNYKDFEYAKTLPTFSKFIKHGAYVEKVQSVYPTVTYTCHTSLSTGHYPKDHKVYNNEYAMPHKPTEQDWRWFEWDIKSPTFFDYATKANLTTASLLWPVMAGADVTYNVPEIWSPDHTISRFKLLLDYGTKNMLWPVFKYKNLLQGTKQPYLDNFTEAVSLYTLKKYKPDVMAIHFTELDTFRHIHGLDFDKTQENLKSLDARVGNIINLTKKLGLFNKTNFVLLGDHGTHTFHSIIQMNRYLLDKGYLTCDPNNKIESWHAYACTCGGSCHIHVSSEMDNVMKLKLQEDLYALIENDDIPVKKVFTREKVCDTYQLDGDFDYVLEAEDGYAFRNSISDNMIEPTSDIKDYYNGDHGYLPTHEDMYTSLMMMGPDIKKGAHLRTCNLVDEGPTIVKLLGDTMEKVDGVVLEALLEELA